MKLLTKRAELNLLTESDFEEVLQLFHEPGTFDYIQHLQNKKDPEYVTILNGRLDQIRTRTGYHWVARTISDGQLIGVLNLSTIPGTDKTQLGFQLGKNFWNKGFGLELAGAVLNAGTGNLGFQSIYGVFHKENLASQKILQRLNFQPAENFLDEQDIIILQFKSEQT